jgi:5'(3')-deoxyribonucleotidase
MPKKPVIAVDNDDVLFALVEAIFDYYNQLNQTKLKISDQKVFNLDQTFGLTQEETLKLVFDFYNSPYMLQTKPIPGALRVLRKLKINYDLIMITARPDFTKKITLQALKTHYPDIFSSVYLTNTFSKTGPKKLKSEVCLETGASLMIDDAFHNAEDCANKGIPVVMFRRPWNESVTASQLKGKPIYPAKNWTEVSLLVPKLLKP